MFNRTKLVSFSEYDLIIHDKIDDPRNAHRNKIADDHIPAEDALHQQQESQTQQKDCRAGNVIIQKCQKRIPCLLPVFPDIEIGYQEISYDSALKGYRRRDHVFAPIPLREDQVRKHPEDKRVDQCADQACPGILQKSDQSPPHGVSPSCAAGLSWRSPSHRL